MAARLPPLNALRAFEAAGRNQSFVKAAEELFVTPGAISRQIHTLEEHLGFPLFHRAHREVRLTAEAQTYLESMTDVLAQIERATHRLMDSRKQRLLHLHTPITFTLRWLVPRLSSFHVLHPKSEIRLSTSLPTASELCAAPTDVTFHIRDEGWPEAAAPLLVAHRLVDVELIPVCAPGYRKTLASGRDPSILAGATLLHSSARQNDWASWLDAAGVADVNPRAGIRFESSSLAYQAAIDGVGVAVAMRAFVERDLASGILVAPFDLVYADGSAFHLTYSKAASKLPQILEFRDWVLAEAAAAKVASDARTGQLKAS